MNASAEASLLSASGISKRFGGVRALHDVAFDVCAGEVHGLIGANGAGKSTLINILSGAIAPDSGSLAVRGRPVPLGSIGEARRAKAVLIAGKPGLVEAMFDWMPYRDRAWIDFLRAGLDLAHLPGDPVAKLRSVSG